MARLGRSRPASSYAVRAGVRPATIISVPSTDSELTVEGSSIVVNVSSSDSATGVEASGITANVSSGDSAVAVEAASLAVSSSDSGTGGDAVARQAVNPVSAEAGIGLESGPAPPSALSGVDSGTALDAGVVGVADTDSASGIDQSTWWRPNAPDAWDLTSGQTAVTLTAGTVGDLRVIEFVTVASTKNVSSLSGGGVTTWQRAGSVNAVVAGTGAYIPAANVETWYGRVTSAGTALTVTYSAAISTTECIGVRNDYRNPQGSFYGVVATGFAQTGNTTTSSPVAWPSLSTTAPGQLVLGNTAMSSGGVTGSTTGYTYYLDSVSQMYHCFRVETAPATEVEAPTMTYAGTQGWYTSLAIFSAQNPLSQETELTVESSTITATLSSSDSMTGVELAAVANPLSSSDVSQHAAEGGSILAHLSSADSSVGVDSSTAPAAHVPTADSSPVAEASSIVAFVHSTDGLFGIDAAYEEAPPGRTAVVPAEYRVIVVPSDGFVVPVPFEDRTVAVPDE